MTNWDEELFQVSKHQEEAKLRQDCIQLFEAIFGSNHNLGDVSTETLEKFVSELYSGWVWENDNQDEVTWRSDDNTE